MADLKAKPIIDLVYAFDSQSLKTDHEDGHLQLIFVADDEYGVVEEELHLDLVTILVVIIGIFDQSSITGLLALVQQVLGLLHQRVDLPDHVVETVVVVFI